MSIEVQRVDVPIIGLSGINTQEIDLQEKLYEKLNRFETLPFLFIGSGLSIRYIDLEDWKSLLRKFSSIIGRPFSYYLTKSGGDLAEAGGLLAEDFHKYWYDITDDITIERYEKKSKLKDISSPLKIEISKHLNEKSKNIKAENNIQEEIELLKLATFDGIITTNWDVLLEHLFPDFKTYVGQNELLNSIPQMIGEIYKIHGSCSSVNSLVLTSEDYSEFKQKNPYLIAKLLTLFIEHPIIFLGYSLSDDNILEILDSVISCLSKENLKKMEKRLIFVEWDEEKKGDAIYTDYLISGDNKIPLTVIRTDNYAAIFQALCSLERKLPTKFLRQIKELLYQIVITNDPKGKIDVLVNINDDDELENARFVIGVGELPSVSSLGYNAIHSKHLVKDLIFDELNCEPDAILLKTIPRILGTTNTKYIPIFKYLRKAQYLSDEGILSKKDLDPVIVKFVESISTNKDYFRIRGYEGKIEEIRNFDGGILAMSKFYGKSRMLYYITLMEREKIEINELETFLRETYDEFENSKNKRSYYHKIAGIYDWLKFGGFETIEVRD